VNSLQVIALRGGKGAHTDCIALSAEVLIQASKSTAAALICLREKLPFPYTRLLVALPGDLVMSSKMCRATQ